MNNISEIIIEENDLRVVSEFSPAGDQPTAIEELVEGLSKGEKNQVLLGATGTGKTFTMAKIIEATQRPALILAPNKTLAGQLFRISEILSQQRCGIFCFLLRLLPARSLCPGSEPI